MANEELISQYIDPVAIKANTDFLIAEMRRAKAEFQNLTKTISSVKQAKSLPDITGGIAQAEQQAQAIIKSQEKITEVYKKQSEVLKQHGTVVSAFDKAQADAAISATAFGNSQNKATAAVKVAVKENQDLLKAKLALSKAERSEAVELQKYSILKSEANKASKEEALRTLGLLTPYQELTKRYNVAAASAKDLAAQFGVNSIQAKAAGKEALSLNKELQAIDRTVGQSQKNVGNYGSAFNKILGPIRNIANILPGLGIAGIFGILFSGIEKVTDEIDRLINKLNPLKTAQKAVNDTFKDFESATISALSKVSEVKSAFELASKGVITKKEALEIYNEKLGDTLGKTNDLNEAERLVAAKADIFVKVTGIKAQAMSLFALSAKETVNGILAATKDQTTILDKAFIGLLNFFGAYNKSAEAIAKAQGKGITQARKDAELNATAISDAAKKMLEEAEKLARDAKLDFTIGDKAENSAKVLKKLSDQISTAFEKFKLEQQRYIDLINDGVDDEKNSFEYRIELLRSYTAERKVLINEQEKNDIAAIRNKLAVDVENLNKEKKKGADIAGINKEIAIITFNANEQIELIEKRSQIDRLKADDEFYKKKRKLSEDFQKEAEKNAKETAKAVSGGNSDAEEDLGKVLEERKKKMLSFLDTIQYYWEKVSGVISGALNIGFTNRKNAVQDAIDGIERQKDAELKANDARVQSEQDKAANIAIINSRADQARELQRNKQRQIDQQQARAEKALAIFNITIDTAKNIVKATTLFGRITAALIGAAQLAIVLATPIPRFFKGKKKGQAYSGPAIVNDHPDGYTTEVIERGDGTIEIPKGRNVLTHIGADDIIHPDKNAWLNAILNAAHRDAISGTGVKEVKSNDAVLVAAMNKQTQKIVNAINNKTELHLGAGDRGMVALWKHGASTVKYIDQNTNW